LPGTTRRIVRVIGIGPGRIGLRDRGIGVSGYRGIGLRASGSGFISISIPITPHCAHTYTQNHPKNLEKQAKTRTIVRLLSGKSAARNPNKSLGFYGIMWL
jgi:hypothetical protein